MNEHKENLSHSAEWDAGKASWLEICRSLKSGTQKQVADV